jgi:hypothetical protein
MEWEGRNSKHGLNVRRDLETKKRRRYAVSMGVAFTSKFRAFAVLTPLLVPGLAAGYDSVPPSFPFKDGWMGGDAAYSIPLDDSNRTVWLFGDTFVRSDGIISRAGASLVGNSLAIRTSDGVQQTINYYWQGQNTTSPDAFFSSGTKEWRYWPGDGFMWNGKLYVCLNRIQNVGDGVFGFQSIGVSLARVANPGDPPPNWQITCQALYTRTNLLTGISAVATDGYAYLFTCRDDAAHKANRPVLLQRIPLGALDTNASASLEYLNGHDLWVPGLAREDAKVIMQRGATEMTVRWHPERNCWVAVQMSNEYPAHRIWRRQAPNLEGPWSEPVSIFSVPEYRRTNPGYGAGRFFYAGKEHIEFLNVTNGAGLVTYVGNSDKLSDVIADLKLYVPEPVQLTMDPQPGTPGR